MSPIEVANMTQQVSPQRPLAEECAVIEGTSTSDMSPPVEPQGHQHRTYTFRHLDSCNMCGAPVATHVVLGKRLNSRQGLRPRKKAGILTSVMRCDRCGLISANPQPVPASLSDHYGVPPETYWTSQYFAVSEDYFARPIETFQRLWRNPLQRKTPAVVDIGAGIGKAMHSLSRAGFDTWGIEPSDPFWQRAIDRMQIPSDRLQLTSVEEAEFAPESFDWVCFGAVLEHLFDPSASLLKAFDWLRPGGLIYMEVPSSDYLMSRLCKLFYRATGAGDYVINTCPMHAPFHLFEFTPHSFELHAEAHGHEVAFQQYLVCDSYMPWPANRLFQWWMGATNTGMQLEIWLRKK